MKTQVFHCGRQQTQHMTVDREVGTVFESFCDDQKGQRVPLLETNELFKLECFIWKIVISPYIHTHGFNKKINK
jgi:hypothetical protein